jgi:hypothetical protein
LLRRAGRYAHLSVGLAVALVTVAAAMGVAMYDDYREKLRQPIFASSVRMGYLFERVAAFAWIGAITYVAGVVADAQLRELLWMVFRRAFIVSAALALATAVLGTAVATYRTF